MTISSHGSLATDKLVDRFLDEYKVRYGNLRSQHYVHRLPHIKTALGKKKADAVRVADVHKFRDKRLAEGASPGTVRKEMVALGTVYKWGMQMDLVMTNLVYAANKPPEPQHRERYLTPKEWKTLLKALPEWLTPMATVAAFTGLRLKEVTNIARSDVDKNAGLIYVQPDNKTCRGRYVLPGKAVDVGLAALSAGWPAQRSSKASPSTPCATALPPGSSSPEVPRTSCSDSWATAHLS